MPTLEQATAYRLQQIADVAESGATLMIGKARREYEGGAFTGRFGGMRTSFPELWRIGDSPKAIAAAIRRGKGKVYDRVHRVVQDAMSRDFEPARKRSPGPATVPPHQGRQYCKHCRIFHTKGQHRFHGKDAFLKTHLFPFGNPMTLQEAKRIFAELMQVSRRRALTVPERELLRQASQQIRYEKRRGSTASSNTKAKVRMVQNRGLTRAKARQILEEGRAAGRKLTSRQRRFFGARASGYPRRNAGVQSVGKMKLIDYYRTAPHECNAECKRNRHLFRHSAKGQAQVMTIPPYSTIKTGRYRTILIRDDS
jgi:hypothetical protein